MPPFSVVIIDNYVRSRISLRKTLIHPEFKVLGETDNGCSGFKLLQILQPDIAILDIDLPGISGITLIQRFKQLKLKNRGLSTKILVLTMQDTAEAVLGAFTAGADSYCLKGNSTKELVDSIRTTAQGYSWIDPAIARFVVEEINSLNSETHPRKVYIHALPPGEQSANASDLTEREQAVLLLLAQGKSDAQIADTLFISSGTVKSHIRHLFNKLKADNRTQAVVKALRSGIIS